MKYLLILNKFDIDKAVLLNKLRDLGHVKEDFDRFILETGTCIEDINKFFHMFRLR